MSGVGAIGGGSDTYYYNLEQNQAYIMAQNQLVPVDNSEVEEILKKNDIQIKNGKAYSISDGFELKNSDIIIMAGIGGTPSLPPTNEIKKVGETKPNVGAALNRLADSSGSSAALLFMQLMTLMKSARDDKETNSDLKIILQGSKVQQMKGEMTALKAQHEAENDAEATSARLSASFALVSAVASCVASCCEGSSLANYGQIISSALSTIPAMYKRISYENGSYAEKGKQSINQAEFQKQEEIIQQAIDLVKGGSDNARKSFQSALKLLQGVAERQNDNIKAMNI